MKSRACYTYVALAVLAGCENVAVDQGSPSSEPVIVGASQDVPPEAPPGTCWDKIVGPSVTGTVTEQVLVKPADLTADGQVENPAVYFESMGVGLNDGATFGAKGHVRLNFGCPMATLKQGLDRMERAVGDLDENKLPI